MYGGGGFPPGGGPPGYPPGSPPGYPPGAMPGQPNPYGAPHAPPMYAPGVAPNPYGAPAMQSFGMVPHAPFGIDPMTGLPFSDKEKHTAALLNLLFVGAGRIYLGHTGIGIAQILVTIFTCGLGVFWPIIDTVMIMQGSVRDSMGRPLR